MHAARTSTGFTLIELMVTLSVLSVLLAVGAPSFGKISRDNLLLAETQTLRGVLAAARSEAQTSARR